MFPLPAPLVLHVRTYLQHAQLRALSHTSRSNYTSIEPDPRYQMFDELQWIDEQYASRYDDHLAASASFEAANRRARFAGNAQFTPMDDGGRGGPETGVTLPLRMSELKREMSRLQEQRDAIVSALEGIREQGMPHLEIPPQSRPSYAASFGPRPFHMTPSIQAVCYARPARP